MDFKKVNWKAAGITALIVALIPAVLTIVMQLIYTFYVGFQTRGDNAAIMAAAQMFWVSWFLLIFLLIIPALLAFWRARQVLARASGDPLATSLAGTAIGMLACFVMYQPVMLQPVWPIVVAWVLALGAAYMGATMGGKAAGPAR